MPNTTAVAVQFTLNSADSTTPYEITGCSGQVTYDSGPPTPFSGWNAVDIGTPDPNGASFSLNVVDSNYAVAQTSIANWAVTFIPRPGTSQASPFGNNVNTLTGTGASTNQSGNFGLNLGGNKIKNAGSWDWMLMVQMKMSDNSIKCFASDPEMDVDS